MRMGRPRRGGSGTLAAQRRPVPPEPGDSAAATSELAVSDAALSELWYRVSEGVDSPLIDIFTDCSSLPTSDDETARAGRTAGQAAWDEVGLTDREAGLDEDVVASAGEDVVAVVDDNGDREDMVIWVVENDLQSDEDVGDGVACDQDRVTPGDDATSGALRSSSSGGDDSLSPACTPSFIAPRRQPPVSEKRKRARAKRRDLIKPSRPPEPRRNTSQPDHVRSDFGDHVLPNMSHVSLPVSGALRCPVPTPSVNCRVCSELCQLPRPQGRPRKIPKQVKVTAAKSPPELSIPDRKVLPPSPQATPESTPAEARITAHPSTASLPVEPAGTAPLASPACDAASPPSPESFGGFAAPLWQAARTRWLRHQAVEAVRQRQDPALSRADAAVMRLRELAALSAVRFPPERGRALRSDPPAASETEVSRLPEPVPDGAGVEESASGHDPSVEAAPAAAEPGTDCPAGEPSGTESRQSNTPARGTPESEGCVNAEGDGDNDETGYSKDVGPDGDHLKLNANFVTGEQKSVEIKLNETAGAEETPQLSHVSVSSEPCVGPPAVAMAGGVPTQSLPTYAPLLPSVEKERFKADFLSVLQLRHVNDPPPPPPLRRTIRQRLRKRKEILDPSEDREADGGDGPQKGSPSLMVALSGGRRGRRLKVLRRSSGLLRREPAGDSSGDEAATSVAARRPRRPRRRLLDLSELVLQPEVVDLSDTYSGSAEPPPLLAEPPECRRCGDESLPSEPPRLTPQRWPRAGAARCRVCRLFIARVLMPLHLRLHRTGYRGCDVCGTVLETDAALYRHRLGHEPPQHTCQRCGRCFDAAAKLERHRATAHGSVCSRCGLRMATPELAASHDCGAGGDTATGGSEDRAHSLPAAPVPPPAAFATALAQPPSFVTAASPPPAPPPPPPSSAGLLVLRKESGTAGSALSCAECGKSFLVKFNYNMHMKLVHKRSAAPASPAVSSALRTDSGLGCASDVISPDLYGEMLSVV